MGIIRFAFKFEEQWWQKRAGIVYNNMTPFSQVMTLT